METIMDVIVAGAEKDSVKMEVALYIVDMTMYIMIDFPVLSPMWMKSAIPGIYTQQMDYLQIPINVLQMAGIEIAGTERKEGINCYVLEVTPDITEIFKALMLPAGV